MKKVVILLTTMTLLFSLAGCGGSEQDKIDDNISSNSITTENLDDIGSTNEDLDGDAVFQLAEEKSKEIFQNNAFNVTVAEEAADLYEKAGDMGVSKGYTKAALLRIDLYGKDTEFYKKAYKMLWDAHKAGDWEAEEKILTLHKDNLFYGYDVSDRYQGIEEFNNFSEDDYKELLQLYISNAQASTDPAALTSYGKFLKNAVSGQNGSNFLGNEDLKLIGLDIRIEDSYNDVVNIFTKAVKNGDSEAAFELNDFLMWNMNPNTEMYDAEIMIQNLDAWKELGFEHYNLYKGIVYLRYDRNLNLAQQYFEKADQENDYFGTFYAGYVIDMAAQMTEPIRFYPDDLDLEDIQLTAKAYYEKILNIESEDEADSVLKDAKYAATVALANLYNHGYSTVTDKEKSAELLSTVEEYSYYGDAYPEVSYLLKKAKNETFDYAYSHLAYEEYSTLYNKAEGGGDTSSFRYLAAAGSINYMSKYGQSFVSTDIDKAMEWFERAANKGSAYGYWQLARVYFSVPEKADVVKAEECIEKSIEMYKNKQFSVEDYKSEQNAALSSASNMMRFYVDGNFVEKDLDKARYYYDAIVEIEPSLMESSEKDPFGIKSYIPLFQ